MMGSEDTQGRKTEGWLRRGTISSPTGSASEPPPTSSRTAAEATGSCSEEEQESVSGTIMVVRMADF